MTVKEEHRIRHVAVRLAKNRLFISVLLLDVADEHRFMEHFEIFRY